MGFGSSPFGSSPFGSASSSTATTLGIVDFAFNPLALGSQGQMLGWEEPPAAVESLALRIYDFLIESIRKDDLQSGNLFVKRFLEGPQTVWAQTWNKIFELGTLNDVTTIRDEFLSNLQDVVGWAGSLKQITARLSPAMLRRLISVSARFWKRRGTEDGMTDTLRLLTGARLRSWNWFDYRWVLEETGTGHEQQGYDPWMIGADNDREINIRIVDNGDLDRELCREMLKLMRPSGERIEVVYLSFLDLFETDGDNSQWEGDLEVVDGVASLADSANAEEASVSVDGVDLWGSYVACWRAKGSLFGVTFHRFDEDNKYVFWIEGGVWTLTKTIGGIETDLASGAPAYPFALLDDEFYLIRVEVIWTGSTNQIKVYVDGVLMASASDSALETGGAGIIHRVGGTVDLDELEVIPLPVSSDFIDINS